MPAPKPDPVGRIAPAWKGLLGRVGRLTALCLLVAVLFGAVTAGDLLGSRQRGWQKASEAARQLSLLVGQEIEQTVGQLDHTLQIAAERLASPEFAPLSPALRRAYLFDRSVAQEHVRLLFLVDAEGRIALASREDAGLSPDQAAMDHVRVHRDRSWGGLYISAPLPGPDGQPVVALSRRLERADGGFAGAVVGLLDLGSIRERLEAHLQGVEGGFVLGLHRHDGLRLVSVTSGATTHQHDEAMAEIVGAAAWKPNDAFILRAPAEDHLLGAFAWVGAQPLLVSATREAADIEAEWRAHAITLGLTMLGLLVALLTPIMLLQREVSRRRAAEQEAWRNSDEFRLLTENSSDMVTRIGPDRKRRYISPACRRILGQEPADLIGSAPRDVTHPEDRQQMIDTLRPVYAGEQEEATSVYRIRHSDGRWIWLEASVRSVRDPVTGLPDGVVAVTRDITERKRLEGELARVATEDPLTGLANRRAFDAGFERELHRCAAIGQPVAILLIDVDHFKPYNDEYGHPEGDACLRRVAAVIAASAIHPLDLAARYGGEEFILLLPGLLLHEAARRAETVRAAVEALAIPHRGADTGHAVVTVSIGLAAAVPGSDAVAMVREAMIQQADHSLYDAKRLGRNRVAAIGTEDAITWR